MHVRGGGDRGLFVSAAALSIGLTYANDTGGNWIIFVVGALAIMLYSLEKGCDVMAGVFWAVVAIKPQDGFLLAIPLLLAKKWKTIFVAGGICLLATWIASVFIGKPMVELILEVPKIKSGSQVANLLPQFVYEWIVARGVAESVVQYGCMLTGLALCVALSLAVRQYKDWRVKIVPAILCASLWTYMAPYDRCIFFVVQIVFAREFLQSQSVKERIFLAVGMIAIFCSGLETILQCSALLPRIGEILSMPCFAKFVENTVIIVYGLGVFLSTIVIIAWCILKKRSAYFYVK